MSALKLVFPRVHFRYDECPYADDLEHFAAWLCGRAYRNKRARTHLYNVQQFLLDLAMPSGSKLDLAKVAVAFRRSGDARVRYQHSFTIFTQFLRSRGQLIEPPPKVDRFESIRREFCERLVDRRGLRPSSVGGYDHWIADFLSRSLGRRKPLQSLTTAIFESYIKARQPELAACTLRNAILCIRAFLQFCFERGLFRERIDFIDRPLGLSDDKPPRALAWPMIQRFLRSIDRSDWVGRRDYLILHLMAYYGLRPGEVGLLTLDAIDWARGTMTINQEKTLSTLILPIDDRTMRLLRSFIEGDRPATKLPWVIPKAQAPEGRMSKFAMSFVFKTRARRSGLPITHCSSYALRHSFAMRLFGRGIGCLMRRLFDRANVRDAEGRRPRFHDLRHSFAVQSLIRIYRAKGDVQSALPKLALYMGHVSVESTLHYVRLVPEVAALASERFEAHFGHWVQGGKS